MSTLQLSKLAELRAKTDRELVGLIHRLIVEGTRYAQQEALKLLPAVDDSLARMLLEGKLRQLREALDKPSRQVQTASAR